MNVPKLPLLVYEAWRHLPTSYLVCTDDQAMPLRDQEAMIRAARAEGGVVHVSHVKSGHSPFLSKPDEVVKWIERVAEHELVRRKTDRL